MFEVRLTSGRVELGDGLGELADVLRGGAAAATDDVDAEVGDEAAVELDELLGGQVVVHVAVDHRGQPGVGQHRDRCARVRRQVPHVLAHLLGTRRAVDADHVGAHRVERHERGTDLGAGQHAAGQLDGHLGLDGDLAADLGHRLAAAVHARLDAQQVELGLEQQHVHPAAQQPAGLLGDLLAQLLVADVAERGEAGAGPDGTGDEAGALRGGELVRDLSGDARRSLVELLGALAQAVLVECGAHAAEAVGLHHVGPGGQVLAVHRGDQVRPRLVEDLGAALQFGRAVVLHREVLQLQPGASGAVVDDDAVADGIEVGGAGHDGPRIPVVLRRGPTGGCAAAPPRRSTAVQRRTLAAG